MDPVVGIAAVGIGMVVVYRLATTKPRPAKGTAKNPERLRSRGPSGKLPKRSWLVKAYNSSGANKLDSDDLSGATAELTGRALGAAGRRSRTKWSRRWRAAKTAAERSRARREKQWQQAGRPPLLISRKPKTRPEPAQPKPPSDAPSAGQAPKAPATPGPEPPKRHLAAVPDHATNPGGAMTTTDEAPTVLAAADAPPDWALLVDRVSNFTPEDDAALIAFMRGEAAAVVRYAEALEQARENCTNEVGLDPSAVQGFVAYSEQMSEASERMTEAYRLFMAVYGEVQALAASGVTLPYNGRWFTGNAS